MIDKEDITIFVSVYNRPLYTEKSLKSLSDNWSGKVYIVDDCSDAKTKDILKQYEGKENWTIKYNETNQHIENVIKQSVEVTTPYVYITDNDVEYSSQFEKQLLSFVNLIQEKQEVFVLSLFNSPAHQQGSILREPIKPDIKVHGINPVLTTGGISMFTHTTILKDWIDNDLGLNVTWDYRFCFYCQIFRIPILQSKNSYVDHMGEFGVNSNSDRWDRADKFIK